MVKKTRNHFSRSAVSLAVAAALPGAVFAQDAGEEEAIEEIVTVDADAPVARGVVGGDARTGVRDGAGHR